VTRAEALAELRAVVVALAGYASDAVLLSYGDRPRPATPHLYLWVVSDSPVTHPLTTGPTVTQHRDLVVQIDARGAWTHGSAAGLLERLAAVIYSDTPAALGVAVQDVGEVIDGTASERRPNGYEPATNLRIRVRYIAAQTVDPVPLATEIRTTIAEGTAPEYTATSSIVVAEEAP